MVLQVDPKITILALLEGNISVLDKSDQAITVNVGTAHLKASAIPEGEIYVEVAEVFVNPRVAQIGAGLYKSDGLYDLNIWTWGGNAFSGEYGKSEVYKEILRIIRAACTSTENINWMEAVSRREVNETVGKATLYHDAVGLAVVWYDT